MTALQDRLEDFRQQRRVQAGSLIVSAFGDAILPRGGRIWLGSLICLLAPLNISERLIRTAVFRLVRDEWLQGETRGRRADYLLTPAGQRRCAEAARQIYAAHAPDWDGRWRLVLVVGELPGKVRDQLRRSLFWQGFGALGADCFVHPGADLAGVLDALAGEGLGLPAGALLPLLAADTGAGLSASDRELVRRAWDLAALGEAYSRFVAIYRPILAELQANPAAAGDQEAFLLRLLLIHDYRRLLLRDPELPAVLLPVDWPGQQARHLCAALYQALAAPTGRHLDDQLCLADGSCPAEAAGQPRRFA